MRCCHRLALVTIELAAMTSSSRSYAALKGSKFGGPMIRWLAERLRRRLGRARNVAPQVARRPAPVSRNNPWHAVSLVVTHTACARARNYRGKRWLAAQAPRIPLSGCDANACECRYRHHDDRRTRSRRYSDEVGFMRPYDGPERRNGPRSRRTSDA